MLQNVADLTVASMSASVIDSNVQVYSVTVDTNNKFILNNNQDLNFVLKRGKTYIFDQSDATNSNHPITFYTVTGTPQEVTNYITTSSTAAGSAGASVTFIVPSDYSESELKLYCDVHGENMGSYYNPVAVQDNSSAPISTISWVTNNIINNGNPTDLLTTTGGGTPIIQNNKYRYGKGTSAATGNYPTGGCLLAAVPSLEDWTIDVTIDIDSINGTAPTITFIDNANNYIANVVLGPGQMNGQWGRISTENKGLFAGASTNSYSAGMAYGSSFNGNGFTWTTNILNLNIRIQRISGIIKFYFNNIEATAFQVSNHTTQQLSYVGFRTHNTTIDIHNFTIDSYQEVISYPDPQTFSSHAFGSAQTSYTNTWTTTTNLQNGDDATIDLSGYIWSSVPDYLIGGTQLKTIHKYVDNGQNIKITVTDGYNLYLYLIYDRMLDAAIDDGGWGPNALSHYTGADGEVYSWTKVPDAELPKFTYTGNFTNTEIVVSVWYIRVGTPNWTVVLPTINDSRYTTTGRLIQHMVLSDYVPSAIIPVDRKEPYFTFDASRYTFGSSATTFVDLEATGYTPF